LSTKDLGSLRLTCKFLEQALFDDFVQEFFVKRQFMLTEPSLQALIDISRHPNLSKKLKHVVLSTDYYDRHLPPDDDRAIKSRRGMFDQWTLLSTGLDIDMLVEAFRGLPNLETIGIRDYDAKGRLREGERARWNSYGATTVFKETGLRMQKDFHQISGYGGLQSGMNSTSRMFSTVIYALGKAGCKVAAIEVILRKSQGLYDTAFNIPSIILPTVRPVLNELRTLLLTLDISNHGDGLFRAPETGEFLALARNLEHLRVNFVNNPRQAGHPPILDWLSEPVSVSDDVDYPMQRRLLKTLRAPPIPLRHLRQLDLGMLTVDRHVIWALLRKFAPTLQGLSLHKITLHDPRNVVPGQPYLSRDTLKGNNQWSTLFSGFAEIDNLRLQSFSVNYVRQIPHSPVFTRIYFKFEDLKANPDAPLGYEEGDETHNVYRGDDGRPDLTGYQECFDLRGDDTMAMIAKMAKRVLVPIILPQNRTDMDEGHSDEDEEMDDDDMEE
jgi:hypothetical protein